MPKLFPFVLFLAIMAAAQSAVAQTLYYPPVQGSSWDNVQPQELGFCPENVDSLFRFLEVNGTKSFLLLFNGKIALEKYFGSYTKDSLHYWASAGKSLSAFLIGQAIDEGLLSLSDKTSQYLGQGWTSLNAQQEEKITVRHQITMTTGLDDAVMDDNCTQPECLTFKADAGTRWAYHNAPYHLVHNVLEAASGTSLQQFTKTRVLDKTGMKGFWFNHVQYGRARDMGRFGLLMLGKGVWDGDTLLHDQGYFEAMTVPSQGLNPSYGYLWWLNGQPTYMLPTVQFAFPGPLLPNAPPDLYAALGKNDQKIHVVPSKGWVVVRQGDGAGASPVPIEFDKMMWDYLNALECGSPVQDIEARASMVRALPTASATGWRIVTEVPLRCLLLYNSLGLLVRTIEVEGNAQTVDINPDGLMAGCYSLAAVAANGSLFSVRLVKI